ncbi:MAG: hypothetical protein IT185_01690 [Acidobacteria bacterium]|nr:hypothetical protein [Acidobacteriota bacterium]
MSAKWIGIGIVVATAAVGGYVALRQSAPKTVPTAAPVADAAAPSPQVEQAPVQVAEPAPVVARPSAQSPQSAPPDVRRGVSPRPSTTPAVQVPVEAAPPPAAAPPVSTPPPPVVPPVATEAQRYVPDPPPPTPIEAPLAPSFTELIVTKSSVIGITLDHAISTRTARVEDRVSARVSREVRVAGDIAIPEGARLEGTIVLVERGGKFREAPRLGIRFTTLVLPDNTRVTMGTDAIYREGTAPTADATAKVGTGAVIGAVLGAVLGGKKGALLGGTAGAAGGAAAVANGEEAEVALKAGTALTVKLTEDLPVLIRR